MLRRVAVVTMLLAATAAVAGCAGSADAQSAGPAQTISVAADGAFTPSATAKAGVPIRLEFGPGGGCTAAIQFPEHGIYEDLTDGGGVVELPALSPGTYPLLCQSQMEMGVLVVD